MARMRSRVGQQGWPVTHICSTQGAAHICLVLGMWLLIALSCRSSADAVDTMCSTLLR